jgi:hypothetical protein
MKYFVGPQGWEVRAPGNIGRRFIEPGTLIDDSLAQWAFVASQGPPIDALPVDQATYDAMLRSPALGGLGYEYFRVRPFGAGIVLSGPGTGGDYWSKHPIP